METNEKDDKESPTNSTKEEVELGGSIKELGTLGEETSIQQVHF